MHSMYLADMSENRASKRQKVGSEACDSPVRRRRTESPELRAPLSPNKTSTSAPSTSSTSSLSPPHHGTPSKLSAQSLMQHNADQESVSSCGASSEMRTESTNCTHRDKESEYSDISSESDSDASSADYEDDYFGCWQAVKKLCSGNNGQVYLGKLVDPVLNVQAALKVEKRSPKRSHLQNELCVFNDMRGAEGFPKVLDNGLCNNKLWMVMELLGPSLRRVHDRYRFDEDLTLFLGIQMLERLQALHSKGYVHLSVKPDNFCLQVDSQGNVVVHMIDFGRCEKYIDEQGRHLTYGNNRGGPFSRWYHSAGALRGKRQSRRDDLQSLAYSLVYFFFGDDFVDWREGLRHPESVDVAHHYRYRLPEWLLGFVSYCTSLGWAEEPDYDSWLTTLRARLTGDGIASASDLLAHATRKHFRRLGR